MMRHIEVKYVASFLTPQTACVRRNPAGQGILSLGGVATPRRIDPLIRRRRRSLPKLRIPAVAAAIVFWIGLYGAIIKNLSTDGTF
jgi:hypothetical protein